MAGPTTGQLGAFRQPTRWGRNQSGNYQVIPFEGTRNEIRALAAQYALIPGLEYEVIEQYGKFRLEVRFPWNADGVVNPATDKVDVWEFFGQEHEKDLLESQDNGGLVASISAKQKEKIRNKIQNPPDGSTNDPAVTSTYFNTGDGNTSNAFTLYNLMQSGMRSYTMPAPVLRHTIITSNQYAVGYALSGVRKLVSTAYLLSTEGLPGALLFNVSSYTAGDVSTDPLLVYGWYKSFPTIQQVALLKWQIVQEWRYGWWPVSVYGNPL